MTEGNEQRGDKLSYVSLGPEEEKKGET